ncbi:symmetrical bis(5'-nucleosyl)-tetraphosphatase [Candidatus Halobeggiatoa sp. HSG11]|nr:symmetrical bis(5'-nucleosyl)-tetraphosphatase [Candidatus Halobeggiatoa sp. HSG11]
MSTYAIGDIQGCYENLQHLLKLINFDPKQDILWFVGDLVNRGPNSLEVLRFVKNLGKQAVTVMGNHDLHLLAIAHGNSKLKDKDTLENILSAPDREELLQWLRHRPFWHYDSDLKIALVHAGVLPQWNLAQISQYASELETVIQGKKYQQFLANMYGNNPNRWSKKLQGWERLRFISNCLTRLRYCNVDGKLNLKKKDSPIFVEQNNEQQPWFTWPNKHNIQIIFGHWASLGYHADNNVYALDTGCVWGGALTALRIEDKQTFSMPCKSICNPNDWL